MRCSCIVIDLYKILLSQRAGTAGKEQLLFAPLTGQSNTLRSVLKQVWVTFRNAVPDLL